jgi:hypothetical protein
MPLLREVYSAMAKLDSIRVLLMLSARNSYPPTASLTYPDPSVHYRLR